jgi:pimeloyl-ACP methyl ester carboxylesterase
MKTILALLLLAAASGCATAHRTAAPDAADPGRLPSASLTLNVPGLRPCSAGDERALHLDPRQPVTILVYGHNGTVDGFGGLAAAFASQGQQTVCFEYDSRASMMQVSGQLAGAIDRLAPQLDAPRITVIGHSLGGLIARKALVRERPDPLRSADVELQLVTVSAPFSGVAAARMCANPLVRAATLGLTDLVCWLISGDDWYEITPASDFIRHPGELQPQVRRHLMIVTDERGTCRRRAESGRCVEGDDVLSVAEQQLPAATPPSRSTLVEVHAGHSEIIGGADVIPRKLIAVLFERAGIARSDELAKRAE